ncbi:hypothetical protein GCM10028810_28420 [Spirosoma litoris]
MSRSLNRGLISREMSIKLAMTMARQAEIITAGTASREQVNRILNMGVID